MSSIYNGGSGGNFFFFFYKGRASDKFRHKILDILSVVITKSTATGASEKMQKWRGAKSIVTTGLSHTAHKEHETSQSKAPRNEVIK